EINTTMSYEKLDFDEGKSSNLLSSLLTLNKDTSSKELAEKIFIEEFTSQIAENPQVMTTLAEQLSPPNAEYKMVPVQPLPGFVAKTYTTKNCKQYQNVKVLINICYSDVIPRPPAANEEEIRKAMNAEEDAMYNVPLVLSDLRQDMDKDQNECLVCDAIIHSDPYKRTIKDSDFKLYITELAVELIEDNHKLQLSREFIFPKASYKGKIERRLVQLPKEKPSLIAEIPTRPPTHQKKATNNINDIKTVKSQIQKPEYIIVEEHKDNKGYIIIAIEIPLIGSQSINAIILDVEPSRLLFNLPGKYSLDINLSNTVDITTAVAKFIKPKKRLNSGNINPTQDSSQTWLGHEKSPQNPQRPTDPSSDTIASSLVSTNKGKETVNSPGKYSPTPVLNDLILKAVKVTLQDQNMASAMLPTK
ncbi:1804_t:CDS:2, partial [Racocetra persica]